MAINITNVVNQIETRLLDSGHSDLDLNKLVAASNRINNSGVGVLTYRSPNHLPDITDSNYIGRIAYVEQDNVLGDSDGRFFMATGRTGGWVALTSLQDSAEANVVAGGGGAPSGSQAQGTVSGYTIGGGTPTYVNTIDKFPFSSFTTASDVGDLTDTIRFGHGASSATDGYLAGGSDPSFVNPGPGGRVDTIQKFPFASDTNATNNTGVLFNAVELAAGGIHSSDYAYVAGGTWNFGDTGRNVIQKYSMTTDASATDAGDLLTPMYGNSGCSSSDYGYSANGYQHPSVFYNTIQKWPFSSDANAADVGDTTSARNYTAGQNSTENGYSSGGSSFNNIIEKWSFSSDGNASDVGDLVTGRRQHAGQQSSTENGYYSGGNDPGTPVANVVQSFSFSSDENAVDAGDLSQARIAGGGAQV